MTKKETANKINDDIDKGFYDDFPKLKSRMEHIAAKLIKSFYCHNIELSKGEYYTLKENGYE